MICPATSATKAELIDPSRPGAQVAGLEGDVGGPGVAEIDVDSSRQFAHFVIAQHDRATGHASLQLGDLPRAAQSPAKCERPSGIRPGHGEIRCVDLEAQVELVRDRTARLKARRPPDQLQLRQPVAGRVGDRHGSSADRLSPQRSVQGVQLKLERRAGGLDGALAARPEAQLTGPAIRLWEQWGRGQPFAHHRQPPAPAWPPGHVSLGPYDAAERLSPDGVEGKSDQGTFAAQAVALQNHSIDL